MVTEVVDMMLQMVFNGSISVYDMDIERKPYHRNCTCALQGLPKNLSSAQAYILHSKRDTELLFVVRR